MRFSPTEASIFTIKEVGGQQGVRIYRFDLGKKEPELVLEGDIIWYNLYGDALYYTEREGVAYRLCKADLNGENREVLCADRNLLAGFAEDGKLYLWSWSEDVLLVYNPDGTQDDNLGGLYDIKLDSSYSFGYGDGWIFYTSLTDGTVHRVRSNGQDDQVLFEGHSAGLISYADSWVYFVEETPTGKEHQYSNQLYVGYQDGDKLLDIFGPDLTWGLENPHLPDFQYKESENGDGVVITGYTGYRDNFEIPSELDGRPVVGIGDEAFKESLISEIAIPGSVRRIGYRAFGNCDNLTFVGLTEGLEEIGERAFQDCGLLTTVDLPEGLRIIGDAAFAHTRLSRVYIPVSVEKIYSGAFGVLSDAGLTGFEVAPGNENYQSVDGVLYSSNMRELVAFPSGAQQDSYRILDGVEYIHSFAFEHCQSLKQLEIPESVSQICNFAFIDTGLTEIAVSTGCNMTDEPGGEITVNYY